MSLDAHIASLFRELAEAFDKRDAESKPERKPRRRRKTRDPDKVLSDVKRGLREAGVKSV